MVVFGQNGLESEIKIERYDNKCKHLEDVFGKSFISRSTTILFIDRVGIFAGLKP
jgi:hypothetical protein